MEDPRNGGTEHREHDDDDERQNSTSEGLKERWIAWAFSPASKSPAGRGARRRRRERRATLEVSASRDVLVQVTPAAPAARLLESESGEVVSPK